MTYTHNCLSVYALILGNGRPFILEVSGTYVSASDERMREIIEYVSSRHANSLNREGDVELLMLKKVSMMSCHVMSCHVMSCHVMS